MQLNPRLDLAALQRVPCQDHVTEINVMWRCQMVTRTKKMFVGGLSASTTIEDVKAYFESYGKVT